MSLILSMKDIVKSYNTGGEVQVILNKISLDIHKNDFVSVLGPSGSGKSTLMNIMGCLDVPCGGTYVLAGHDVSGLNEKELAYIRNREIGFVFQSFQLLPRLSAMENVELPMLYSGKSSSFRRKKAAEILERVGLKDKMRHLPNQLSGGQQQRVAIARAVVTEPSIILADEPTGALDQKTGQAIMSLFKELVNEGRTIVMITHDTDIASQAERVVKILDGRLAEIEESSRGRLYEIKKGGVPCYAMG